MGRGGKTVQRAVGQEMRGGIQSLASPQLESTWGSLKESYGLEGSSYQTYGMRTQADTILSSRNWRVRRAACSIPRFSPQSKISVARESSFKVLHFLSIRSYFSHIMHSHRFRISQQNIQNLPSSSAAQASMVFSWGLYILLPAVSSATNMYLVQKVTRELNSKHIYRNCCQHE